MLKDIFALATQTSGDAFATVGGAVIKAANDILNEAPNTNNHEARKAWALSVLENPQGATEKIYRLALANPTLAADFSTDPFNENADSDAQYVVNSIVSDSAALSRLGFGVEVSE